MILVFSVNESRHFQGYARMMSKIGSAKSSEVWAESGTKGWGGDFQVRWLKVYASPNFTALVIGCRR